MNKHYFIISAGLVVLLAGTAVFAQERPKPDGSDNGPGQGMMRDGGPRPGMMERGGKGPLFGDPERMQKVLGLTEDQMDRIADINEKVKMEHRAVMDKIEPKARQLRKILRAEEVDLEKTRTLLKEIGDLQVESRMIMIRHRLEIEKVLNAEQRAKLRDMRPEMAGPMMRGPEPDTFGE
jgi:Spy/CpxP family protein refolding chaperone